MSSKLFAFNVSKKPEKVGNQWVGNRIARAGTVVGYCSGGQDYGMSGCIVENGQCSAFGTSGYYICDGYDD